MTIPKNQLSSLVPSQLPEFVRIDHPTLVAFLSAYYEWLETNSELYSPMALEGLSDVDETMDKFVSQFKKQYLLDLPLEKVLWLRMSWKQPSGEPLRGGADEVTCLAIVLRRNMHSYSHRRFFRQPENTF